MFTYISQYFVNKTNYLKYSYSTNYIVYKILNKIYESLVELVTLIEY